MYECGYMSVVGSDVLDKNLRSRNFEIQNRPNPVVVNHQQNTKENQPVTAPPKEAYDENEPQESLRLSDRPDVLSNGTYIQARQDVHRKFVDLIQKFNNSFGNDPKNLADEKTKAIRKFIETHADNIEHFDALRNNVTDALNKDNLSHQEVMGVRKLINLLEKIDHSTTIDEQAPDFKTAFKDIEKDWKKLYVEPDKRDAFVFHLLQGVDLIQQLGNATKSLANSQANENNADLRLFSNEIADAADNVHEIANNITGYVQSNKFKQNEMNERVLELPQYFHEFMRTISEVSRNPLVHNNEEYINLASKIHENMLVLMDYFMPEIQKAAYDTQNSAFDKFAQDNNVISQEAVQQKQLPEPSAPSEAEVKAHQQRQQQNEDAELQNFMQQLQQEMVRQEEAAQKLPKNADSSFEKDMKPAQETQQKQQNEDAELQNFMQQLQQERMRQEEAAKGLPMNEVNSLQGIQSEQTENDPSRANLDSSYPVQHENKFKHFDGLPRGQIDHSYMMPQDMPFENPLADQKQDMRTPEFANFVDRKTRNAQNIHRPHLSARNSAHSPTSDDNELRSLQGLWDWADQSAYMKNKINAVNEIGQTMEEMAMSGTGKPNPERVALAKRGRRLNGIKDLMAETQKVNRATQDLEKAVIEAKHANMTSMNQIATQKLNLDIAAAHMKSEQQKTLQKGLEKLSLDAFEMATNLERNYTKIVGLFNQINMQRINIVWDNIKQITRNMKF